MKKVLVTGSTGFIGSEFVNKYSNTIKVVRDKSKKYSDDCFYIKNLDNDTCWDNAFSDIDVVIHLAGLAHSKKYSLNEYHSVNVEGTLNLAKQALNAGVSRFVFLSSIGVNGQNTYHHKFTPYSDTLAINDYTRSKLLAEVKLKKLVEGTSLELVIVRPPLVYGKNAPGNFETLMKLIKISPLLPFGLANNKRDFIFIQNLIDLLITCINHTKAGGHTFLASDCETVSIKEFTNAIASGLGKHRIQLPIPVFLMRFIGKLFNRSDVIEQLYGNLELDTFELKKVLNWSPPLSMKEAMVSLLDSVD